MFKKANKKVKFTLDEQDQPDLINVIQKKNRKVKVNRWIESVPTSHSYTPQELQTSDTPPPNPQLYLNTHQEAMKNEMLLLASELRQATGEKRDSRLYMDMAKTDQIVPDSESAEDNSEEEQWTQDRMNRGKVMPWNKLAENTPKVINKYAKIAQNVNFHDLVLELIRKRDDMISMNEQNRKRVHYIEQLKDEVRQEVAKLEYESLDKTERFVFMEELSTYLGSLIKYLEDRQTHLEASRSNQFTITPLNEDSASQDDSSDYEDNYSLTRVENVFQDWHSRYPDLYRKCKADEILSEIKNLF